MSESTERWFYVHKEDDTFCFGIKDDKIIWVSEHLRERFLGKHKDELKPYIQENKIQVAELTNKNVCYTLKFKK